ncbi:MAG: hypothetical protein ACRD3C_04545 [Vicinamibacterales bacterium]
MDIVTVPAAVRKKLGDAGTDGLVTIFADAHRMATDSFERRVVEASVSFDRKLAEISTNFDRKLADMSGSVDRKLGDMSGRFDRRLTGEISKFRVEMIQQMSNLRFDVLKWNFLFWIGQLAAMTAILSVMLRGLR